MKFQLCKQKKTKYQENEEKNKKNKSCAAGEEERTTQLEQGSETNQGNSCWLMLNLL